MDRHREERSDAAIQKEVGRFVPLDCFAVSPSVRTGVFDALWLAMTIAVRAKCNLP